MFSKRQKIILSYILYTNIPIKLDILADIISVSVPTIRTEIDIINRVISTRNVQIFITKKGQCYIGDEKKESVLNLLSTPIFEDKNNTEKHIVWDRIYLIIGMLAFESDYVSMEELSERLFVSKSTINLDITEIKRIIARISGISFVVSSTKGLKLTGKEEDFRYLLAKMIVQGLNLETSLTYINSEVNFDVSKNYLEIYKVLREVMVKHRFIISGKAFGLVCATLLICSIRNQLGFILEKQQSDKTLFPMIKEIGEYLEKEYRLAFSNIDLFYIQQFITEQNQLYIHEKWKIEDQQIVSVFNNIVKEYFQIDLKKYPNFEKEFTFYINQLNQRVENGHDYTNFYKRQINRLFPMTANIVACCQQHLKKLGVIYSAAELAYITLFLGNYLETEEPTLKLLLISDEHTALINWIVSEVHRLMGTSAQIINAIPKYLFEENKEMFLNDIDVILTTSQINVSNTKEVIFIHSLFGKTEKHLLHSLLISYVAQSQMKNLKEIENVTIGNQHFIPIPECKKDLESCVQYIFGQLGYKESLDTDFVMRDHFIPNDTKIGYVSFMKKDPGQSKIIIGKLPKSITYRNKSINMILLSFYHKNDYTIASSFYKCIRFLMEPSQSIRLGKAKDYADIREIFEL